MTVEQRKSFVKAKSDERKQIQTEIQDLNKKRQEYITTHTPKENQSSLDGAMMNAVKQQAKTKNLKWK
jgi:hypothetical protein